MRQTGVKKVVRVSTESKNLAITMAQEYSAVVTSLNLKLKLVLRNSRLQRT